MLAGLCPRPVVRGDDEEGGVDLPRPDEHVADEPVVTRNVDEVELGSVVQREMGVADVDRHAARPLFRQAVRVDAGQGPEQGGLAVVDVAGGPDDDGHRPFDLGARGLAARSTSRAARIARASA